MQGATRFLYILEALNKIRFILFLNENEKKIILQSLFISSIVESVVQKCDFFKRKILWSYLQMNETYEE